jgi:hypothetical protein
MPNSNVPCYSTSPALEYERFFEVYPTRKEGKIKTTKRLWMP